MFKNFYTTFILNYFCVSHSYLNSFESTVEKGWRPFTMNFVTVLWHSFTRSSDSLPLAASVKGSTPAVDGGGGWSAVP